MAAEVEYIAPDRDFVKQIINFGGESLKKCFQCGACSVTCSLSPREKPFPRKEMIWAQWGLKDRLLKDPDVWLCHQCNDCSTNCPRGAKPGDVLAAIRNYSIQHFVLPNFLAKSFSWLIPLLFSLVIILFWIFLPFTFTYTRIMFFIVGGLVFVVTVIGLIRFWRYVSKFETKPASAQMGSEGSVEPVTPIRGGFLTNFVSSLVEVLKHSNFRRCEVNKGSFLPHFLIFYGFIALFISCFGAQIYSLTQAGLPLPLTNPLKIIGIIGGLALLTGLTLIIYRRLFRKGEVGKATYYDWFFIVLVYLITITGLAGLLLRLVGEVGPLKIIGIIGGLVLLSGLALIIYRRLFGKGEVGKVTDYDWFFIVLVYLVTITGIATLLIRLVEPVGLVHDFYLAHLVFIFAALAYLPFSKIIHPLYRILATTYAKQIGREAEIVSVGKS